jgi:hypothetical protein
LTPREVARYVRDFARLHPWWIVAVGLLAVAYVVVRAANTRPSYDAYGWLVWGHQTLHLALDLGGAPSWKPLPFLFTVPFSLFGSHAVTLWMVFATAVALSGFIFAGRIAYRLVGAERGTRPVAWVAAIVAGLGVLGIDQYEHYILTAQSDPMIVALCLAAVDLHLSRRYRLAFICLVFASLGRPEAWPFAGAYAVWVWREMPSARLLLVAGVAVIPALWFGVPTITNGRPFVSAELAQFSVHRIVGNRFTGTFDRYFGLTVLPVKLLALAAIAIAALRRRRAVLVLATGAVVWVLVELAFALHGWPALPRYMFESGAAQCVLAGAGLGWIALELPGLASRVRAFAIPRWVSIPVAVALVGVLVPGAIARVRAGRQDLHRERWRSTQIVRLQDAIREVGGYRHVRYCGRPVTYVGFVSILAYDMRLNVGFVGHKPKQDLRRHVPVILFTEGPDGWTLEPSHLTRDSRLSCNHLEATVIFNRAHPGGIVVTDREARWLRLSA